MTQFRSASDGSDDVIRVVVCGEKNAGKSTFLNALLRNDCLPDNIGADVRPSVRLSHRNYPGYRVSFKDVGTNESVNIPTRADLERAESIAIWTNRRHLAGFEFIELPLTTAEDFSVDQLNVIESADVLVWVTIASQAWRLTERNFFDEMGDSRPKHSMLVVSRGDKLRTDKDREKLLKRMERETAEYFSVHCFLNGARRVIDRSDRERKSFESTGGAYMSEALDKFRTEILKARAAPQPDQTAQPEAEIAPEADPVQDAPAPAAEVVDLHPKTAELVQEVEETVAEVAAEIVENPNVINTTLPEDDGILVAGIVRETNKEFVIISGDVAPCDTANERIFAAYKAIAGFSGAQVDDKTAYSFILSTKKNHLLCRDVPGEGLAYVLTDNTKLSLGAAQLKLRNVEECLVPAS